MGKRTVMATAALVILAIVLAVLLFTDFDGDGLSNINEVRAGTSVTNPDTDNDVLSDGLEANVYRTNPLVADTDNDGLQDGLEVFTYKTNPLVADSDGDGPSDGAEVDIHGTNPLVTDSDYDNLSDGQEVLVYKTSPLSADTDNDNLSDFAEITTYGTNPLAADTDNDGLSDYSEVNVYQTDPLDNDTDHDKLSDGTEVNGWSITVNGQAANVTSNPLSRDTDGDNLSDWAEYITYNSNPRSTNTDNDSMGGLLEVVYATNLASASSVATQILGAPTYPYLYLEIDYMTGYSPSPEAIDYLKSYFDNDLGVDVETIENEVTSSALTAIGVTPESISPTELVSIEAHFHNNPTTHLYVFYAAAFDNEAAGGLSRNSYGVALNGAYVTGNLARERTILLHEIGHALGMQESSTGVMQSGPIFLNPAYSADSWAQRNLLNKFSVDEPW